MTATTRRRGSTWRSRWRRLWRRLRGGALTPRRLARSVGLGLFVGVQPIYGLHLPVCAAIALPLRLDLVATYLAANISIAPVAPFLIALEVELGSLILTGRHAPFTVQQARALGVSGVVSQAVVGAAVLGLVLGLGGGLVTWLVARRLGRVTPLSDAVARTVARYAALGRAHRSAVATRLETDPIVESLAAESNLGRLVEAGAGRGELGLLLLELGRCETVTEFDDDPRRVAVARAAAGGDARVERAATANWSWEPADTVLLVAGLRALPAATQDAVLRGAAASLAPGGRLYVRDRDGSRPFARWAATLRARRRGMHDAPRPTSALGSVLDEAGLEVESRPDADGFGDALIVARRPPNPPVD